MTPVRPHVDDGTFVAIDLDLMENIATFCGKCLVTYNLKMRNKGKGVSTDARHEDQDQLGGS